MEGLSCLGAFEQHYCLSAHVASIESLLLGIIKEEILEVRRKYADPRRTEITAMGGEIDPEDLIQEDSVVVTLTHFGYVKRLPKSTYRAQHRGGKGVTGMSTREEDFVERMSGKDMNKRMIEALIKAGREDLIGYGEECLVRPAGSKPQNFGKSTAPSGAKKNFANAKADKSGIRKSTSKPKTDKNTKNTSQTPPKSQKPNYKAGWAKPKAKKGAKKK